MAIKPHSLLLPLIVLFFLLSTAAAAAATPASTDPPLGAYHPIPIARIIEPIYQQLGEFAVTQHNKDAGVHYEFIGVVAGEYQNVAGTNYRLIIVLYHHERIANYNFEAVVFVHPTRIWNLTSFTRLSEPGPWLPTKEIDYPHLEEIGRFAISEHNQQTHDNLVFRNVIGSEYQVVAGINYRLSIVTTRPPFPTPLVFSNVRVFEKPWNGFRNVTSFGLH